MASLVTGCYERFLFRFSYDDLKTSSPGNHVLQIMHYIFLVLLMDNSSSATQAFSASPHLPPPRPSSAAAAAVAAGRGRILPPITPAPSRPHTQTPTCITLMTIWSTSTMQSSPSTAPYPLTKAPSNASLPPATGSSPAAPTISSTSTPSRAKTTAS